jgi:hypothetical protein
MGTFSGAGAGNGTFNVTYSQDNDAADLARVGFVQGYKGPLNGEKKSSDPDFTRIYDTGVMLRSGPFLNDVTAPVLSGCDYDTGSTVSPVDGINVYEVTVVLSGCTDSTVDGTYTGFATSYEFSNVYSADQWLVLAFSNGSFSGSGLLLVFT